MKSLGDEWEMGMIGLLTHDTDMPSSCLRLNRKLERASYLEAEAEQRARQMWFLPEWSSQSGN